MAGNYAIMIDNVKSGQASLSRCIGTARSHKSAEDAIGKIKLKHIALGWGTYGFKIFKQKRKITHDSMLQDIMREDIQELELAAPANL